MSEPILTTKGATKRFDGLVAVNDITYELSEGESAGIIGPNGAGKSTFFNLLTGYFKPDAGQIFYRGREISDTPPYERVTSGIARTFQLVSVFDSMTVLENMMLARVRLGRNYRSKTRFFSNPRIIKRWSTSAWNPWTPWVSRTRPTKKPPIFLTARNANWKSPSLCR